MTLDRPTEQSLSSRWQYGRLAPMPTAVPSGWDFVRLTEVARLESGHTPSRKHPEYWDGRIPWVSLHDSKVLDRPVIKETAQTIGESVASRTRRRGCSPAVPWVFVAQQQLGKATILGREMATSQDSRKLRLRASHRERLPGPPPPVSATRMGTD